MATRMSPPSRPMQMQSSTSALLTITIHPPKLSAITYDGTKKISENPVINADDVFLPTAIFDTSLATASGVMTIINLTSGKAVSGTSEAIGNSVVFHPSETLVAGSRYAITLAPTIRSTNGAAFGQTVVVSFETRAITTSGTFAVDRSLIRITIPENGRSTISG